ncbi:MAG: hypothetical protein J5697_01025 [Clostridia bacterium]|nr:hypothetical protein [Clostridia bacterium]
MKSFRFKFHPSVWFLLAVALVLSGAGVGFNIYNFIEYLPYGAGKTVPYIVIAAISALVFILSLSMLVRSKYIVKDGYIISCFGFLRSKIKISELSGFSHFKKTDKLVAYFKNGKYAVIVVSPAAFDDFVAAVREYDKTIICTRGDDESTPV